MLKSLPHFALLFSILLSCSSEVDKKHTPESIYTLQQKIADSFSSESFKALSQIEKLITEFDAPDSLKAENNYLLGLYYNDHGMPDSATVYFHNATDYVKDSIYSERQGVYFQAAWRAYYDLGKYGDCFSISDRFKSLIDPNRQHHTLSWVYYNEQLVYMRMKDYEKALEINTKRLELAREKDSASLPAALVSRANLLYFYLDDRQAGLKILEDLMNKDSILTHNYKRQVYGDYGVLQYFEKNYNTALKYYLKSLESAKKEEEKASKINNVANCYCNVAEVYIDLKQYDLARVYLDTVRSLGIVNLDRKNQKNLMNYELRLASEAKQNIKELLAIQEEIHDYQDELYRVKFEEDMLALQKANAKEKHLLVQQQLIKIENLKLQSGFMLLLVVLILLVIIGILYLRQRKLRYEKEGLELQQRLLRSQMNPHFTFNTLSAIQHQFQTNTAAAGEYLIKFSRLLRLILENSIHNFVKLEYELDSARKYMDLQLLRFPDKFDYSIELVALEEDDLIFIPPMLLQPFIENSIEHGFAKKPDKGHIFIKLVLQDSFIHCTIDDNGVGLNNTPIGEKNSASIKLISEFLRKVSKSEITITDKRKSSSDESGLRITFLIPFKRTGND